MIQKSVHFSFNFRSFHSKYINCVYLKCPLNEGILVFHLQSSILRHRIQMINFQFVFSQGSNTFKLLSTFWLRVGHTPLRVRTQVEVLWALTSIITWIQSQSLSGSKFTMCPSERCTEDYVKKGCWDLGVKFGAGMMNTAQLLPGPCQGHSRSLLYGRFSEIQGFQTFFPYMIISQYILYLGWKVSGLTKCF